jgi:GNAT superfamily N-acetyltransferase
VSLALKTSQIQWRLIRPEEAPMVHALHLEAITGMDPGLVRADELDHFVRHTGEHGMIIGGFANACDLVSYGVLGISSDIVNHLAHILDLDIQDRGRFGSLDGAAALHAWRGRRLHRELIAARLEHARARGITLIGVTVAPGNIASLRGLMSQNFQIRKFAVLYEGCARLVLTHDALAPAPRWSHQVAVAATDLIGHQFAMMEGLNGYGFSVGSAGEILVHYGVDLNLQSAPASLKTW